MLQNCCRQYSNSTTFCVFLRLCDFIALTSASEGVLPSGFDASRLCGVITSPAPVPHTLISLFYIFNIGCEDSPAFGCPFDMTLSLSQRKRKQRKTKSKFRIVCGYSTFFWFRLNHAQPIRMRSSDNWNLYVFRKPGYFVLSQILTFWAWCSVLRSCGRAHAVKVSFRVLEWMEAVFPWELELRKTPCSVFSIVQLSYHMFSPVFLVTFSTIKEFQCESTARLCQFQRIPLRTRRRCQAWEVD